MFNESAGYFKAHLTGPAVEKGRIDVEELLMFVSHLKVAIYRVARLLAGAPVSLARGRQPQEVREQCRLQFVGFEPGSAQLSFDFRTPTQPPLPFYDNLGEQAVRTLLEGLPVLEGTDDGLPPGYDLGVLHAWRGAGKIFRRGIDQVTFVLLRAKAPASYDFGPQTFEKIERRIRRPIQGEEMVVEGRLLMADFKETDTRCRIHPPVGEPIMCSFEDEMREEILAALTRHVRVRGKASIDIATGKIRNLKLADVEVLEDEGVESVDFWDVEPIESLARSQGATLNPRFEELKGDFWPEDESVEDFINFVRQLK